MGPKPIATLTWLIIIGILGYWAYVSLFGTGYESKGWQHFSHVLKGVSLELDACDRPAPRELGPVDATDQHPKELKSGELVAAQFQETDRTFYVFLISAEKPGAWLVVHRPKSDYKGFVGFGGKIWLTEVPKIPAGVYFLVAGVGSSHVATLEDGSKLDVLPSALKYTDPQMVNITMSKR